MKSFDPEIANRKIAGMTKRIDRLMQYQTMTLEDYLMSEDTQLVIERLLELIIQSSLDINRFFLKQVFQAKEANRKQPLGNKESFLLLGKYGVLSDDFAKLMSESGSFRNILAHFYDEIEPKKVYEALQFTFVNYPIYIRRVQTYLDLLEAEV